MLPSLIMDGNANEAIEFYEEVLNAKVLFRTDANERISHARIKVGQSDFVIKDSSEGKPAKSNTLCLFLKEKEQAEKIFNALKEEGQVHSPLEKNNFSPAYGIVTDKFGMTFEINTSAKYF